MQDVEDRDRAPDDMRSDRPGWRRCLHASANKRVRIGLIFWMRASADYAARAPQGRHGRRGMIVWGARVCESNQDLLLLSVKAGFRWCESPALPGILSY
eukprot:5600914-Pleurochrysis_carterae.AAC.2